MSEADTACVGLVGAPLNYEVAYSDTDAGGIVYHATYVAMAERSRNHVMRSLGLPVAEMKARFGVLFIIREIRAVYLRPAFVGDILVLSSGLVSANAVRALWRTLVVRDGERVCEVEAEIAAFDPVADCPCLIPSDLKNLIAKAPRVAPTGRAPRMKAERT